MFEEILDKIRTLPKDDPRLPIIKDLAKEETVNLENLEIIMKLLGYDISYK